MLLLANKLQGTHIAHIKRVADFDHIWGLDSIVKCVNPVALKEFEPLIRSLVPNQAVLAKEEGYSVRNLL